MGAGPPLRKCHSTAPDGAKTARSGLISAGDTLRTAAKATAFSGLALRMPRSIMLNIPRESPTRAQISPRDSPHALIWSVMLMVDIYTM